MGGLIPIEPATRHFDEVKASGADKALDPALAQALANLAELFLSDDTTKDAAQKFLELCQSGGSQIGTSWPLDPNGPEIQHILDNLGEVDLGKVLTIALAITPNRVGFAAAPGGGPEYLRSLLVILDHLSKLFPCQALAFADDKFLIGKADPENQLPVLFQVIFLGSCLGLIRYVLGDVFSAVQLDSTLPDEVGEACRRVLSVEVTTGDETVIGLKLVQLSAKSLAQAVASPSLEGEFDWKLARKILKVCMESDSVFGSDTRAPIYDKYFDLVFDGKAKENLAAYMDATASLPLKDAGKMLLSGRRIRPYLFGAGVVSSREDSMWRGLMESLSGISMLLPWTSIRVSPVAIVFENRVRLYPAFFNLQTFAVGAVLGLVSWTLGSEALVSLQIDTQGNEALLEELQQKLDIPVREGYPSAIFLDSKFSEGYPLNMGAPVAASFHTGLSFVVLLNRAGYGVSPEGVLELNDFLRSSTEFRTPEKRQELYQIIGKMLPANIESMRALVKVLHGEWETLFESYLGEVGGLDPGDAIEVLLSQWEMFFPVYEFFRQEKRFEMRVAKSDVTPHSLATATYLPVAVGILRYFHGKDAVTALEVQTELKDTALQELSEELGVPVTRAEVTAILLG